LWRCDSKAPTGLSLRGPIELDVAAFERELAAARAAEAVAL